MLLLGWGRVSRIDRWFSRGLFGLWQNCESGSSKVAAISRLVGGVYGPLGGLGTIPGLAAAPWVTVPSLALKCVFLFEGA